MQALRNGAFKIIPRIAEGSWVIKQSGGPEYPRAAGPQAYHPVFQVTKCQRPAVLSASSHASAALRRDLNHAWSIAAWGTMWAHPVCSEAQLHGCAVICQSSALSAGGAPIQPAAEWLNRRAAGHKVCSLSTVFDRQRRHLWQYSAADWLPHVCCGGQNYIEVDVDVGSLQKLFLGSILRRMAFSEVEAFSRRLAPPCLLQGAELHRGGCGRGQLAHGRQCGRHGAGISQVPGH